MAEINLSKYGITGTTEIVHNPSYEKLFEEETKAGLEGYEVGQETELGAVNVMTGIYTGRSPKDKYIVMDKNSKDTVWWTSDEYKNDNHPMTEDTWAVVKDIAKKELCDKKLFVVDAFCGANKDTRMAIRFIVVASFAPDERDMTKYIIGTFGALDTPLNPEAKGSRSMAAYLEHLTYEEIQKERDEILTATPADIRSLSDLIASILSDQCLCVVGNEHAIREESGMFTSIQGLCE